MPRIKLKPGSPEYADSESKPQAGHCHVPDCNESGDHKAPKHRALNEYYMFCTEHARDYNRAWNFFDGMADSEVRDHMARDMYGDRPTWRYDQAGAAEDILKRQAWQTYNFSEDEPPEHKERAERKRQFAGDRNSPEAEAMRIMGLEPPVTLAEIKVRYKELAKLHHPDLNKGSAESEELLKQINMSYTILKLAYEEFEKLPERR